MFLVNNYSNRKGNVMKHLLVSLRSFGFIALTSLLVVMCSDERQETMGIEEDSSSTNSVYGPSGSGSASLPGTSQGADQTDYSTLEVVDTKVSVSEGNLALTADAISWVVRVKCDFARLPDYPGSNVAYVVGTTGGDDELVRLYKGDKCEHSLQEININGVGCAADANDDVCGKIVSESSGTLSSGGNVANGDSIGYTFQIVQEGNGIDISSAVQGQIESNIEQESSVSVAGIVAPSFSAGSDSFIKDDKAVLHIGLNPSPDFEVAEGASVSAKYNDSAVNAGKDSAKDINFTSGTDCDNLSGCSGAACRYAAGYKYAGSSKDTSFSLKSGGIVCGGANGLSLNQDGSAKSYEVTIEHAKGDHKSYQVITVDIACQPTPGKPTCD
jgi:hypothetical protein